MTERILGSIDWPDGQAPSDRDYVEVRGWALGAASPVARVDLLVDGAPKARAGLGRFCADIRARLSDEAAELAGFEAVIDLAGDARIGREAVLSARVSLLDGTAAELGSVRLALRPPVAFPPAVTAELPRQQARGDTVRLLCVARSLDHGGSQLRLRELMQQLATLGFFKTTVISPTDGPLRHELEAEGVTVRIAPLPLHDVAAYDWQLKQIAAWAAGRFDIVLAATLTSFAGVELAATLGLPAVWRIGEAEPPRKVVRWLGGTLHPELEARARRAYARASVVLFNAENSLEIHRRWAAPGRFAVLGTGADIRRAQAYLQWHDRASCRRELGIGADDRLLLCAGTLWSVKGQVQLVTALAHADIDRSRIKCVLIGQFGERDAEAAMLRLIRRHGLESSVRLVPFCRDLQPWWCAADAVACPSESESMPASVLEGMAFGLPVLATRVGGLTEIVEDGATGWLCEPNDLASLIDGVMRFAGASTEELRRLGQRGARLVAAAHDRAKALPLMSDLLDRLSRGARPRWLEDQLRERSRPVSR